MLKEKMRNSKEGGKLRGLIRKTGPHAGISEKEIQQSPPSDYVIQYLDPVESWMNQKLYDLVIKDLSFPAQYYRQGPFHKIRKDYERKDTIIAKAKTGEYIFYTGLIPRIQELCKAKGVELTLCSEEEEPIKLSTKPMPDSLKLRPFQTDFIKQAILKKRGVLIAPTGTGKTILGIGLIASLYEHYKILWLCHTKSLMSQSAKEFEKVFGKGSVGLVGDSNFDVGKYVTVATRQTFVKHTKELANVFDAVVVDEAHHISSLVYAKENGLIKLGQYFDILKELYCPVRIGLTATRADSKGAQLAMEALLGPVIGEFTINEAREQGYMAHPVIKLTKLSKNMVTHDMRNYADVYESGVVRNLEMNRIISELVKGYADEGLTSLVIVTQIVHGELILGMVKRLGVGAVFINGSTETESRELTKHALNGKILKCVICTAVWKEGVNIPELNVLINAAGGKSELATIQAIGRGMRKTETKSHLVIHDFFNPSHRFLIDHFGSRLCLYFDLGWM
jgi:superfamily II DNA or RNA helicase